MCLTEKQKKVDDIKIVKDVKIIQTMQDREGCGLLIMYKKRKIRPSEEDNKKHRNIACKTRIRKRTN